MFGENEKIKIAISGKANSGKNTLAQLLIKNFGFYEYLNRDNKYYDNEDDDSCNDGGNLVKTIAFADPIKNIILKTFPEARKKRACLYGSSNLRSEIIDDKYLDKNGNKLTFRQALIDFGTLGRQYNENFWIDRLNEKLDLFNKVNIKYNKLFIVSDLRFINEFNFLKNNNFYIIRIVRDGIKKINDVSEVEQDGIPDKDFHKVLLNNKSIEDLDNEVKKVIERMKLFQ